MDGGSGARRKLNSMLPTLRANKWGLPDSHGNTDAWILPTLTASEYGTCQGGSAGRDGQKTRPSLQTMARNGTLPTLTINGNYNRAGLSPKSGDGLQTKIGGQLNPNWCEWFMGFPIGWTDLEAKLLHYQDFANEPDVPRTGKTRHARQRISCLGNAQVPLCAAAAFDMLLARIMQCNPATTQDTRNSETSRS